MEWNCIVPGLKEAAALAVDNNDWRPVRALLEVTTHKDSVEYRQLQQIHVNDNVIKESCSRGFIELVSVFLNSGFPVNDVIDNPEGRRMLHLAASTGHLSLIKLLLNFGADIHYKAQDGETPLLYAVEKGHLEVIKYLITAGADINTTCVIANTLLEAALCYHTLTEEMLQLLLDSGCDLNDKGDSLPLLCSAVWNYDVKIVKMLLDAGAHVNGTDTRIPLHWAAMFRHIPIMQLLLEYGADINARDRCGYTALHLAATTRDITLVEFLIERGSLIDSVNNGQETPLLLSIKERHFNIAMLLINSGADLNLHMHDTLLNIAIKRNAPMHVIEHLLEHGASVTAVYEGRIALQFIISSSIYNDYSNNTKLQIAKLLLIYGSNHHIEDNHSNTVLHWACKMGDVELVEYLIHYGLNVDAKNREGKKPCDIAREKGHTNIVKAIIHYHCNKYTSFN